jgi:hypothetical protein
MERRTSQWLHVLWVTCTGDRRHGNSERYATQCSRTHVCREAWMTNQFGPSEQACLLNASAQCKRIWLAKSEGLHLTHFQTLGQEPIFKEADVAVGVEREQTTNSAAYEQCVRGCLGYTL